MRKGTQMIGRMTRLALAAAAAGVLFAGATACTRVDLSGSGDSRSQSVAAEGAERAEVLVEMGFGDLKLTGGGNGIADAEFRFTDGRFEPRVDYSVDGTTGDLEIRHDDVNPGFGWWGRSLHNEWNLAMSDEIPYELRLERGAGVTSAELGATAIQRLDFRGGAGEVDLDVSGARSLERVSVTAGAGEVTIDLSGGTLLRNVDVDTGTGAVTLDLSGTAWTEDMEVTVSGGVGEITLILPERVAASVSVDSGAGDVTADGFDRDGGRWVNDAWGSGDGPKIEVSLDQGVGAVTLELR